MRFPSIKKRETFFWIPSGKCNIPTNIPWDCHIKVDDKVQLLHDNTGKTKSKPIHLAVPYVKPDPIVKRYHIVYTLSRLRY